VIKRYRAIWTRHAVWAGLLLFASCERNEGGPVDKNADETDYLFVTRKVPHLNIDIPAEGMKILREYHQVWRQTRPERIDVKATVHDGLHVYTNVAVHLKGSFTFQPIDAHPSLTLNFNKFARGQRFHGLTKLHLNNTVQDPSYLSEAFARDLFNAIGVPTPRAGHAVVALNGRPLGVYVLLEGANKPFLARHFQSTAGNLYDGGSGGEITSELAVESGDNRDDRSALANLVEAAQELDPGKRWTRLNELLDVDEFLSFIAGEVLLIHWDGYATGAPNNYRVFHDMSRGKFVFIPHGLDQLLGSGDAAQKLTPHFNGLVARALVTTPEGRRRYLERIEELGATEFRSDALLARVDRLETALRANLTGDHEVADSLDARANYLKSNIANRTTVLARLLKERARPISFDAANTALPAGWRFKTSNTRPASGRKAMFDAREILEVQARGPDTAGAWRTQLLLESGRYEFTGRARTDGLDPANVTGTTGVILRVSGEKFPKGITSSEWTTLHYEFDVRGIEDVELVCEFRGSQGSGFFDPASMRLIRRP
jgi:spore coat protein H